jgi:hypothetical protein
VGGNDGCGQLESGDMGKHRGDGGVVFDENFILRWSIWRGAGSQGKEGEQKEEVGQGSGIHIMPLGPSEPARQPVGIH